MRETSKRVADLLVPGEFVCFYIVTGIQPAKK